MTEGTTITEDEAAVIWSVEDTTKDSACFAYNLVNLKTMK